MSTFKDLLVYKKAFALAMDIFHITKKFPPEEKYGLTNQIRKSSRSVCSNLGEGYRKRRYEAHFVSKVSNAIVGMICPLLSIVGISLSRRYVI